MDIVAAAGDEKQVVGEKEQPAVSVPESMDRAGTGDEADITGSNGLTNGQSVAATEPNPVPETSGDQAPVQPAALPPIHLPETGEEMIEFVSCSSHCSSVSLCNASCPVCRWSRK